MTRRQRGGSTWYAAGAPPPPNWRPVLYSLNRRARISPENLRTPESAAGRAPLPLGQGFPSGSASNPSEVRNHRTSVLTERHVSLLWFTPRAFLLSPNLRTLTPAQRKNIKKTPHAETSALPDHFVACSPARNLPGGHLQLPRSRLQLRRQLPAA